MEEKRPLHFSGRSCYERCRHPIGDVIVKRAHFGFALLLAGTLLSAATNAGAPTSIALPGDRVFPENIASSHDGTLYVGSLGSGGVIRADPKSGSARLWIKPGAYGTRSIFGVYADDRSNTLWTCSNDMSALGVVIPGSGPASTLTGFDLRTGKGKIAVPLPGTRPLCNDMTVGADGAVFVTDSDNPQVLKLAPGAKQFEVFASNPEWQSTPGNAGLDGIAFGSDGNLYVDTFTAAEIFRIAIDAGKPGKVTKLTAPRQMVLTDAMRTLGHNSFLLIEGAGRLDRMTINGDAFSIETLKDGFAGPTAVARVGTTAWVSEGQLQFLFDASKKGQGPNLPFRVYAVPLPSQH
jgi:streptogramin lyase